eukprot:Seg2649.3 transcript_id=Seg2649.3/GoldUCD/mRNA.D3Y31 product="hypothetical protein" protein_id=Seg2649.3/GoldUCD/D3Y31
MGNLLTKRARVAQQPETSRKRRKKQERNRAKLPLRYKLLCCNNKVAPLLVTTKSRSPREGSLGNEEGSLYSYSEEDIEIQGDSGCRSEDSLRRANFTGLPGDRPPLPGIGETIEKVLIKRSTKCDTYGRPQSVCYDVDFFNSQGSDRPASRMSLKSVQMAQRLPKRLNPITIEEILNKQTEAAQRKQAFMETKATKIRKQPAISKEMLQKLEIEKQRLLKERLQLKEREAMERKLRIKEVKEEGMEKMKSRLAKVRSTNEEQQRQRLDSVKRKVAVKMETAKEIKQRRKQEQLRRYTAQKIRHHKALIKKLAVEGEREDTFKERITREKFGNDSPASLIKGLNFRARLREDQIEQLEIEVEQFELEEEKNGWYDDDDEKIETYDSEPEEPADSWFVDW